MLFRSRPASRALFDLPHEKAQRILISQSEEAPALDDPSSPMLRELAGVTADLRGKSIDELRACMPTNPMLGDIRDAQRLCVAHVVGKKETKRLAILRTRDGGFVAAELGGDLPARGEMRKEPFAALLAGWSGYRGPMDSAAVKEPKGDVFELEHPYVAGRYTIDQRTMTDRMNGGHKVTIEGSTRDLDIEKFYVRLPRNYDPRNPAGLLVWVDASPYGRPPPPFNEALDSLGIVCIGAADSGNGRLVATRYQLALDAVATASSRFHVDPRRVYITGISGGGRVSSIMQGCFPEVFMGAVPIVGLCFYENVPTGTGHLWPAGYQRPKNDIFALLRQRRMAAMTGQKDFNQLEMQQATELYSRDHIPVKLFENSRMGHELPKPDAFREALAWVDEPYQQMRTAEESAAKAALELAIPKVPETGPIPEPVRKQLVKVTEAGPWTEPAWTAAELLRRN